MAKMISIPDLSYEYKYEQSDFDKAEAFLAGGGFSSTANYAMFGEGKSTLYYKQACHAKVGLSHALRGFIPALIATEVFYEEGRRLDALRHLDNGSRWKHYKREAGETDEFFNWFVYESIFGRFILNRDRPSVKHGWIVSTDLPPALLQSIMIASRHFYEIPPWGFQKFNELVGEGVPKSVAFAVVINSYWTYYGYRRDDDKPYQALGSHRIFHCPSDIKDLMNFIKGVGRGALLQESYRSVATTAGTNSLFFSGSCSDFNGFGRPMLATDKEVKEFIRELRGEVSKEVKIVNPFASTSYGEKDASYLSNNEMFELTKFLSKRGDFHDAIH